jgi:hypothetical protein
VLTKKSTLSIGALVFLTGCQQPVWNKPGASQADFSTERYRCMQESQQQSSSAYVNRYGGAASSGQTTNEPLFIACDLSPKFHPVESRIRSSFGPLRPGVATAWGAKPVVERSAPGCCGTEALRVA